MSVPITVCHISKALAGDKEALASLQIKADINLKFGSFTMIPCKHNPPCNLTLNQTIVEETLKDNEWLAKFLDRFV